MISVSTQFMYNCGALDTSHTLTVTRTAYMAPLGQTLEPWLFLILLFIQGRDPRDVLCFFTGLKTININPNYSSFLPGVLLENSVGGVRHASSNPYPISDQNM